MPNKNMDYTLKYMGHEHTFKVDTFEEVPIKLVLLTKEYEVEFQGQPTPVTRTYICYLLESSFIHKSYFPKVYPSIKNHARYLDHSYLIAEEHKGAALLHKWPKALPIYGKPYHIIPLKVNGD